MEILVLIPLAILCVGACACIYRTIKGPTNFDRIVAFDAFVLQCVGITIVFSIFSMQVLYIQVILVIGLLGFVSTVVLAVYEARSFK